MASGGKLKNSIPAQIAPEHTGPLHSGSEHAGLLLNARSVFAPVISAYAPLLPLVALLGLLASLLEGIGIGMLVPLAALSLSGGASLPAALPQPIRSIAELVIALDPQDRMLALASVVVTLVLLRGLVQAANNILIANIEVKMGRDIRNALSARILALDYPFFLKHQASRLVQIISADSWSVSDAVKSALTMVPAAAGLLVFCALLVWVDWRLFLIVLAGAVLVQMALLMLERRQKSLSLSATDANHALGDRMLAIVNAMRVIRIFGQQQAEQRQFENASAQVGNRMFAARRLAAFVLPTVDLFIALIFIAILIAAYRFQLSIAEVTTFLLLLSRAQPHAHVISQARTGMASVQGAISEVQWLLQQEGPRAQLAQQDFRIDQPIHFRGVSYAFPARDAVASDPVDSDDGAQDQAAISNVSFTLEPGSITALIGPSGSGKTTLANLVCRLLEPSTGAVQVGDIAATDIAPALWRSRMAIAGQNTGLTQGSIADNIRYGRPDASAEDVAQAAQDAGVSEFAHALADGLETEVGISGLSLSGGQRQRIGLARAMLRRPDVLILDEATNSVDAMSEQHIMQLLAQRRHFTTALVISHRRSTLAACDYGIVLDGGKIVETGPVQSLAYYRAMAGQRP